jgi:hypothetical protein
VNELMIHVERIVRPVNAAERRKLRMRQELLAHLQATADEERGRSPGDERAAIERAKLRLGEPAELTRMLRQSVPVLERVLFARLPTPRRMGKRLSDITGTAGAFAPGHKALLTGMALLAASPLLLIMTREAIFMTRDAISAPGALALKNMVLVVWILVCWPVFLVASCRFVFAVARPEGRANWRGTARRGALVFGLQMRMFLSVVGLQMGEYVFYVRVHSAVLREVVACAICTAVPLAASALVARWVAGLRRPHDEWLTLDIAG